MSWQSALYDRQITVFSPEGKLLQIAIKGETCAVIVAQRKPSASSLFQDKLLDIKSVSNLARVSEFIGASLIGLPADCRSIWGYLVDQACYFEYKNGIPIPVNYLANLIADESQVFTQHAYKRLQACNGILIGIDQIKKKPSIYKFDLTGFYIGHNAACCSNKEAKATFLLEQLMKNDLPKTIDETIIKALIVFHNLIEIDLSAEDIEIGIVDIENPYFRKLEDDRVSNYIKLAKEEDTILV